jgi:hypothetical protein
VNKSHVKEVFKVIASVYPNFEVTQDKLDLWTKLLKGNNPAQVMMNVERYILDNKFPPTVADIRAPEKHEAHKQDYLNKIKLWEEEASGVPKHTS